jgi:hypothetical protein
VSEERNAVFPVQNFEIDTIEGDLLCLTVHYFSDREAFDAKNTKTMKFLLPNSGALSLSGMLSNAVIETRKKNPFHK